MSASNRKCSGKDVGFALSALVYFADVDKARMPEMLVTTTWTTIKVDLEELVSRHRRAWEFFAPRLA